MLGGTFLEAARTLPGLTSLAAGLRLDDDAARLVLASTWDSFADVNRQTGADATAPAAPLPDFVVQDGADHYELVGEPMPVLVAPPDAVVRVAYMTVKTGREEEFYAVVRHGLAELKPTGRLVSYHLGRRIEAREHHAAAVSAWRSAEALGELVDPGRDEPLWADEIAPLLDDFRVEHFDAVPLKSP